MRRTEPNPLGPWWTLETPVELQLREALHRDDKGRPVIGSSEWMTICCPRCGLWRDTREFLYCLGCQALRGGGSIRRVGPRGNGSDGRHPS
jgi:hypothetical protein